MSTNPNRELWEQGDFGAIAAWMRQSGADLVGSLGVEPPLRALDLGCGDGTTAVPLAQLGADVVGIDISRKLVEAGRRRAQDLGLANLQFQEGDACQLHGVPDHSFDLTLSVFGAMFAPRPQDVAREMVRVTKPGGRIVMANWKPDDPTSYVSQMLKICSAFTPPPPAGFISPLTWGVESRVLERFGQAGVPAARISCAQDEFGILARDQSPAQFIATYRRFFGPAMNAFEAAERRGTAEDLRRQLEDLARAHNRSPDGGIAMSATFLRVTIVL